MRVLVTIFILLFIAGCGGGGGSGGIFTEGSSSGTDGGSPGGNSGFEGTISLQWEASSSLNVAGYRVYYGASSKTYGAPIDVGNVTTCTLKDLVVGQTYFVAVSAYASSHEESDFSNEVHGPAR
jgi:hypothetical protein